MRIGLFVCCAAMVGPFSYGSVALAQGDDAEAAPQVEEQPSPTEEQAQTHFRAGRGHFDRGRYEQALAEFDAAYELSARPALLYNLYLTHERLGHLEEAIRFLRAYLPDAGDDAGTLQTRLDNLQARLAEQQRDEDAARERDEERERERDAELERLRTSRSDAPSTSTGGVSTGAIVGLAAGGAGLLTFGAFAFLSSMENSDLAETCGEDAGAVCTDDQVSTLKTYNLIADVGLGVGIAGVAVGLVFLLTGGDDEPERDVAVAPWLGPDGGGATYRVRF